MAWCCFHLLLLLGVGDNCEILNFSQRHLTGHPWTYFRNFWFCWIFFHAKLPPRTPHCKNRFCKSKGSPLWMLKKSSNQVFIKAIMWWHLVSRFQNGIILWFDLKNFFSNIQRRDPLDLQILQNQKFLKYVQECPVKCLWLKSKIGQLLPTPTRKRKGTDVHAT